MARTVALAALIALCVVATASSAPAVSPAQALRTCVDRWNQGNMIGWGRMEVSISIRAMSARERERLVTPDAAQRRCTVSLAPFARTAQTWICRINSAGAYDCPLITSDGMPALKNKNGTTNRQGRLTLDVPLRGTRATRPLPWQRRYPHVDGFIEPWTDSGSLRQGLTLNQAGGARHYRGSCSRGSQQITDRAALRCFSDVQLDPCFAPTANWNHLGVVVACGAPGWTSFSRFVITRRS